MKHLLIIFSFLLSLVVTSCSNDGPTQPINNSSGSISLAFDKTTIPPNVAYVKVSLIREGFETTTGFMDLTTDTTAELTLNNLAVGGWLLKVAAFSANNDTLYKGETQVNIIENYTTIVNLTLIPYISGNGFGNIKIYVKWGNAPSPVGEWKDLNGIIMSGNLQFESTGVMHPNVMLENGIYKMWYVGMNNSAKGYIYYATSSDGINWTKNQTPVLVPQGYWASYSVFTPKVIKIENEYRMYFFGSNDMHDKWQIGLATSSDGINWTMRNNPILQSIIGEQYQIYPGDIVQFNNQYYMYYVGRNNGICKIFLAKSFDGINFERGTEPVINPTLTWEGNSIYQPSVIYENGKLKMVYIEYTNGNKLGYAESVDGINWIKNDNPIFSANNLQFQWARNITNLNFRNLNNTYKIYIEGQMPNSEEYKIGVLTRQ